MTYRPAAENRKAAIMAALFVFFAVTLFVLPMYVSAYRYAYQIGGIICAVIGLELYLKYVMGEYIYEAAENDLRVYRITGRKQECVCSLAYSESLTGILPKSEVDRAPQSYPKTKLAVNLCKNLFPSHAAVYYFNFNGKITVLKFEPDAAFTAYANERIARAMRHKEDEENE